MTSGDRRPWVCDHDGMQQRLPHVVLGPGAIGGAVAGALVQAGNDPVLATRSVFDRLVVTTPEIEVDAPARALSDPSDASPADLVFVAVKAHQTASITPWLDVLVDASTTVVVLQNGVEHLDRFAPLVDGGATLVPAVVALPAIRSAPGRVVVSAASRLTIPTGTGAAAVAAALRSSFIRVIESDDWLSVAWTKLMLNAASGGICVIAGSGNGIFADDSDAVEMATLLMEEVALVGRAEGAQLADDLPERIMAGLVARAGGHMSSIVVDRVNGVPTEWDARNGVVARLAERHGIDVPLNRLLTTLIRLGEPADVAATGR